MVLLFQKNFLLSDDYLAEVGFQKNGKFMFNIPEDKINKKLYLKVFFKGCLDNINSQEEIKIDVYDLDKKNFDGKLISVPVGDKYGVAPEKNNFWKCWSTCKL